MGIYSPGMFVTLRWLRCIQCTHLCLECTLDCVVHSHCWECTVDLWPTLPENNATFFYFFFRYSALQQVKDRLSYVQILPNLTDCHFNFYPTLTASRAAYGIVFLSMVCTPNISAGNPRNGAVECMIVWKIAILTNISLCLGLYKIGHSFYGTPIGTRKESIEWCHFQWPWMTLIPYHAIIWSWISQKRYETHSQWNTNSDLNVPYTQGCHFEWPWVILSDLAKYSMKRSIALPLCDSWASGFVWIQLSLSDRWDQTSNWEIAGSKINLNSPVDLACTKEVSSLDIKFHWPKITSPVR